MATTVLTSYGDKPLTDATNIEKPRSLTTCLESESVDKVKRCLFGVPDHRTVRADLSALRRHLDAQSRQRWNFDFRSGAPLTLLTPSTATSGISRWVWTRVSESSATRQDSHGRNTADCRDIGRRRSLAHTHALKSSPSPGPRSQLDKPNSNVKRRRMSLTPSVEVKAKVARSEVKGMSCRGLERRRLLRSTSLLGSPSRMFSAVFNTYILHACINHRHYCYHMYAHSYIRVETIERKLRNKWKVMRTTNTSLRVENTQRRTTAQRRAINVEWPWLTYQIFNEHRATSLWLLSFLLQNVFTSWDRNLGL